MLVAGEEAVALADSRRGILSGVDGRREAVRWGSDGAAIDGGAVATGFAIEMTQVMPWSAGLLIGRSSRGEGGRSS